MKKGLRGVNPASKPKEPVACRESTSGPATNNGVTKGACVGGCEHRRTSGSEVMNLVETQPPTLNDLLGPSSNS